MFKSFFASVILAFTLFVNPVVNAKEMVAHEDIVNVNTASAEEIREILVGIGKVKSQAIVKYREKNGKFENADSLAEVKGISTGIVEKNRNKMEF